MTPHAWKAEFKKALVREAGAQGGLFDVKTRKSKISWHCPFKLNNLPASKTNSSYTFTVEPKHLQNL
jgi:hypothetical protein